MGELATPEGSSPSSEPDASGNSTPPAYLLPDQPAPSGLLPVPRLKERIAWYAGTVLFSLLLVFWGLRLDRADLRTPFYYNLDSLLILPMVKTTMERGFPGAHWRNERMGAPGVQELYDFPVIDHLHFTIIWLMGLFVRDVVVVYNLYFLLTFPLTALTAMILFRQVGLTFPAAAVGGLLYTFLPYHYQRWENHYFLAAYWIVPLSLLPLFAICRGTFPFFNRLPDGKYELRIRTWNAAGVVALAAATASAGAYYAFFACALTAFAGVYSWIVFRTWRAVAAAGGFAGLIVVFGFLNHLPTTIYRAEYRWNPVVDRGPDEVDTYGLKFAHLVMPAEDNNLTFMRRIKAIYNAPNRLSENENRSATLGLLGTAGLLGMGLWLILPFRRPGWPYGPLAAITLFAVLLGTVGGLGSLFNLFVTSSIRCYNRISVFIALPCLLASLWALDSFLVRRSRFSPRGRYLIWLAVLAVGFLDQTPYSWFRSRIVDTIADQANRYRADADFFGEIERRMPAGSKVFCLPYMAYPEVPTLYRIEAYEHSRGYLHTSTLVWSFGAMKGREADAWQVDVAARLRDRGIRNVVMRIMARGFDGLFIDGRGFPPSRDPKYHLGAPEIINEINKAYAEYLLRPVAQLPEIRHADGQQFFLDLRPLRDAYRDRPGGALALASSERREREWVAVLWLDGFVSPEPPGFADDYREGPREATAVFVNPADTPQTIRISMKFGCMQAGTYEMHLSGLVEDRFSIEKASGDRDLRHSEITKMYSFTLPPGRHAIRFRCNPPPDFVPLDHRKLCYFIADFQKAEIP